MRMPLRADESAKAGSAAVDFTMAIQPAIEARSERNQRWTLCALYLFGAGVLLMMHRQELVLPRQRLVWGLNFAGFVALAGAAQAGNASRIKVLGAGVALGLLGVAVVADHIVGW